jgi:glycosyltransferase involved in cell wall biosynthesis
MNNKISIITVCLNSEETIRESIQSLLPQDHLDIEYIVVDGSSSDNTLKILEEYKNKIDVLVSEPDEGLYDALNKGIKLATGDIIGILHSDDIFADENVLSKVSSLMTSTSADVCFSDMVIENSKTGKVIRFYSSRYFSRILLRTGWMPAHPATFIRKSVFERFGYYSLDYKIASDFDFFLRIFNSKSTSWCYLEDITVRMKSGGASNQGLKSKVLIMKEIKKALKLNHIRSLLLLQLVRYFIRLVELIERPRIKR